MSLPFHYDTEEMFDAIYAFEKDNAGKINMDFVNSVHSFWEARGYITEGQKQAIINIYDGYKLGD